MAWTRINYTVKIAGRILLSSIMLIFLFAGYSIYNDHSPQPVEVAEAYQPVCTVQEEEHIDEPELPHEYNMPSPDPDPPQEVALFSASRIPVLAYHSVMPTEYYYPRNVNNPWILYLDTFYLQMRYLYENNFSPISSYQLKNFLFYGGYLPYNPIVLTFDDGYLDSALFVAPIMRQFGFVGMQFLITDYIPDSPQTMTASPVQFMSEQDILGAMDVFEFGSHSHAMHRFVDGVPLLESASIEEIKADILHSFTYPLNLTTGFVYPFGRYGYNALEALAEAGVLFAFTTHEGYLEQDTPPLLIPRFSILGGPEGWSMEHFSNVVWGRLADEYEAYDYDAENEEAFQ